MLRFIFDLEDHLLPDSFQKCYTDTGMFNLKTQKINIIFFKDSILYAFTSKDLDECVKSDKITSWQDFKRKWFSENTTVSQKTPGYFLIFLFQMII